MGPHKGIAQADGEGAAGSCFKLFQPFPPLGFDRISLAACHRTASFQAKGVKPAGEKASGVPTETECPQKPLELARSAVASRLARPGWNSRHKKRSCARCASLVPSNRGKWLVDRS